MLNQPTALLHCTQGWSIVSLARHVQLLEIDQHRGAL